MTDVTPKQDDGKVKIDSGIAMKELMAAERAQTQYWQNRALLLANENGQLRAELEALRGEDVPPDTDAVAE